MSEPIDENTQKLVSNIETIGGFDILHIDIPPSTDLYVKNSAQLVVDNKLEIEVSYGVNTSGFLSGMIQGVSSGSGFMNKIMNKTDETHQVSFSGIMPGKITEIVLKKDETYVLTSQVFLACTSNISMSTKVNFNILQSLVNQKLFYTIVQIDPASETDEGKIWITGMGGTYTKDLSLSTDFKIHAGLFMAGPYSVIEKMELSKPGSYGSLFLTQGFMFDFSKCDKQGLVYLQTMNELEFINMMYNRLEYKQDQFTIGNMIMGDGEGEGEVTDEVIPEDNAEVTDEAAPDADAKIATEVATEVVDKVTPEIAPEVADEVAPEVADDIGLDMDMMEGGYYQRPNKHKFTKNKKLITKKHITRKHTTTM